jgi:hypothetical protein
VNPVKWYLAENGETIGPMSKQDLLDRIRPLTERSSMVWTQGMPDWAEAGSIPELGNSLASADPGASRGRSAGWGGRLRHELVEFAIIAAYLYIVFGTLIAFKFTILRGEGVSWAPWGLAIVKALILGKFILALQAIRVGESGETMLWRIVQKSLIFVLALLFLNVLEEYLVGHLHGKTHQEILEDMSSLLSGPIVIAVLMFMILVPYFTYRELSEGLGRERLRDLFLANRKSAGTHGLDGG